MDVAGGSLLRVVGRECGVAEPSSVVAAGVQHVFVALAMSTSGVGLTLLCSRLWLRLGSFDRR